ncbi:MAG: hypothetical protein ABR555_11630 [Pyrinomonadaceae bacterium]
MIRDKEQWIASIREVSLLPESPIQQRDGRWKIDDRIAAWKALGPRVFDDYLDRFQTVAVEVLREENPEFELEKDQRFAASLYGKTLNHSQSLRKGLAETLALLSVYPEYLTSCSRYKAENTARFTVQEILKNASWKLWASLNDVMPLLAEAAPREFLDAIEHALEEQPSSLDGVFAQEGSGFAGRIYITGLLWGLETLAWDPAYLTRVVVVLGELAAKDPGGNWANRPANSLWTILLPWFPQTCAPVAKRISAVATLEKELPEVAWNLLVNLLPRSQQSSSMTHKPVFRNTIPDDWTEGTTDADYAEQINAYAELAIEAAKHNRDKLVTLVHRMNNLPFKAREQVLEYLTSDAITSLPEDERLPIWNELTEMLTMHRKYADAEWAMPAKEIERLTGIANALQPQSPILKHRRLFTERDFDLYEEKDDFHLQQSLLDQRRHHAIEDAYADKGIAGIFTLAEAVESPWKVGFAFGETARDADEKQILPSLLESESKAMMYCAAGFVLGRLQSKGWTWIDNLDLNTWTTEQKATLLARLPFNSETWLRAIRMLRAHETLYWEKAQVNPYQARDQLQWAVDRLLESNRVNAAISVLDKMFYSQEPMDPEQVVRVLNAIAPTKEEAGTFDPHAITQLIGVLQKNPDTDPEELFKIEWQFLALLDGMSAPSPITLERALATNPDFFCQVIQLMLRSKTDDESPKTPTKNEEALASNAFRLLHSWSTPPGTKEDGTFDGEALTSWFGQVKAKCSELGHLAFAKEQVGKVLFRSPPDPSGLWLHKASAEILNAKDSEDVRSGYAVAIFDSRGVYFPDAEGRAEREYAVQYRKQAEELELAGYRRLADTLKEVAKSYDRQAEQSGMRMRLDE